MKVAEKLEKELYNQDYYVPVIEPFKASIYMSELQIGMSLPYSKIAYICLIGKERRFRH